MSTKFSASRGVVLSLLAAGLFTCLGMGESGRAGAGCNEFWSGGTHFHDGTNSADDCTGGNHGGGNNEYFRMYEGDDEVHAAGSDPGFSDIVHGGIGLDRLHGQSGTDELWGEFNSDDLEGDAGDDDIHGGEGQDSLEGGDGIDQIFAGAAPDVSLGHHQGDTIDDGCCGNNTEKDVVCGGPAADVIDVQDGDEEDTVYDQANEDNIRKDFGDTTPPLGCPY